MAARALDTPDLPLLVFDGDCGFCTTWVRRLEAWLPAFPPSTPWQWVDFGALGLTADDVRDYAWYVGKKHSYAGAMCFAAILRSQPRAGLRFLGSFLSFGPIAVVAALGYNMIARYRHVLPGGTPACAMPRG